MTAKNEVFISFFDKKGSSARMSCEAIVTQLQFFTRRNDRFVLWDRNMIPAGDDQDATIKAALGRCRVAVVLVSAEYLASEHWQREAVPLLAAAQKGQVGLLWQQIEPCNCDQEINKFQPIVSGIVLTTCKSATRKEHEQKISELIFKAWNEYASAPLAHGLGVLPIDQPGPNATTSSPVLTTRDSIALVLTPSGEEKENVRCYQWRAFIRRVGEDQFQPIPNGAIDADPSYPKAKLEQLLQRLQNWIGCDLMDEPVLEIFAPDSLLEEDWGSFSTVAGEDPKPLHEYQPFLLRSSDRLLNRQWNNRRGALRRMHHHLAEGTGAWLPQDQLTKTETIETLDGETQDNKAGDAVITAICSMQSITLTNRTSWLRSILMSMAPLVVWPSLRSSLGKEQIQLCLRHLPLVRKDTSQDNEVGRPHCPDLAHLAKARQKCRQPEVDLRGLTILVDHPDRAPDRIMLQELFSPSRPDPPRAPEGERLAPQPPLLISS